jgi:hypothetical protein
VSDPFSDEHGIELDDSGSFNTLPRLSDHLHQQLWFRYTKDAVNNAGPGRSQR